MVLGIGLLLTTASAYASRYHRSNPFMVAVASWCLLSAATVAAFRSDYGFEQSLSGRYKIYSTMLIVFAYVYVADGVRRTSTLSTAQRSMLWRIAVATSIVFYAAGTFNGSLFLRKRHNILVAGRRQYLADPRHNVPDVMPGATAGVAEQLGATWRERYLGPSMKVSCRPPRISYILQVARLDVIPH